MRLRTEQRRSPMLGVVIACRWASAVIGLSDFEIMLRLGHVGEMPLVSGDAGWVERPEMIRGRAPD